MTTPPRELLVESLGAYRRTVLDPAIRRARTDGAPPQQLAGIRSVFATIVERARTAHRMHREARTPAQYQAAADRYFVVWRMLQAFNEELPARLEPPGFVDYWRDRFVNTSSRMAQAVVANRDEIMRALNEAAGTASSAGKWIAALLVVGALVALAYSPPAGAASLFARKAADR